MRNNLKYTFFLMISLVLVLIGLHFLPDITIAKHPLRKVDILSQLKRVEKSIVKVDSDTIVLPPVVKPIFVDTCKSGITCIEDYSDSTMRGMVNFYKALKKLETDSADKKMVRIAVLGDSFIEGDILTADLRENFQRDFGGCGVGFVPITSQVYGFRRSVIHSFDGWNTHTVTDTVAFDYSKQGLFGRYFIPDSTKQASLNLSTSSKYFSLTDSCDRLSLFFLNKDTINLSVGINNREPQSYSVNPKVKLQNFVLENSINKASVKVMKADSTYFYGAAMDGLTGVVLDNFSLRGSSGLTLRSIPSKTLKEFNQLRPYDLIILQFGLNVATKDKVDYSSYKKGFVRVVNYLKKCFPQSGFLLLSVADRDYKDKDGKILTMPGVKSMVRFQQSIAAETNIAFWNMYQAMGGENSMKKLVHAQPQMANYDYTHINFEGGKYFADMLYETIMYGKEQYERRLEYENQ